MKLRRSFSSHQLLFALGFAAALAASGPASLLAQDTITKKDGSVQQVKIVGASGGNLQIQVGAGTLSVPLATITAVTMAPPADWASAQKAYEAKNYAKALVDAKAVADKYKGLPTDWAQQATSLVGDLYVALNRFPEAEAAYREYQKLYGAQGGSLQSDVGLARIALSKKEYAQAKEKLAPITAKALEEKTPPPASTAAAYGQAFYLLGQVNEAENEPAEALENYLRTVTVFYQDAAATAAAQQRADALRAANKTLAVP